MNNQYLFSDQIFIEVRCLNGFSKTLWYKANKKLQLLLSPGAFVRVPLRTTEVLAVILKRSDNPGEIAKELVKEIIEIFPVPDDQKIDQLYNQVSYLYGCEKFSLQQRLYSFLDTKTKPRSKENLLSDEDQTLERNPPRILTEEQEAIVDKITPEINGSIFAPYLLYGVTGAGKTEVYKALMKKAFLQKMSVMYLLPEMSLCIRFTKLLKEEFSSTASVHLLCALSTKAERKALWSDLCSKKPVCIVGVHLPVLLPIANLGLIIIDEEHERNFQEQQHPKLQSKEIALLRAKIYQCPIILGSATPSFQSLHLAKQGKLSLLYLKNRFGGTAAPVSIVQLKGLSKKQSRPSFWITEELLKAMQDRIERKEQIILYLNRRGYGFFIQCLKCGEVSCCDNCSVSLTLHEKTKNDPFLLCHYCGFSKKMPSACFSCQAEAQFLTSKGIGTQQLEKIVRELFPTIEASRIARADLDSAKNQKNWPVIVKKMLEGSIDILIGTQMITKGYHFPKVTLVGVIWGDLDSNLPVYFAREVAVQKMIQVAGRAGRASLPGEVIVQTSSPPEDFPFIQESDYEQFFLEEIKLREQAKYPPIIRFLVIELSHKDDGILESESIKVFQALKALIGELKTITLLGPTKPAIFRIKTIFFRTIFLKATSMIEAVELITKIRKNNLKAKLSWSWGS